MSPPARFALTSTIACGAEALKGAGEEYSPERPVVALPDLIRLLDRSPARYRAMLLVATFASL
jgi:hypothetical protein